MSAIRTLIIAAIASMPTTAFAWPGWQDPDPEPAPPPAPEPAPEPPPATEPAPPPPSSVKLPTDEELEQIDDLRQENKELRRGQRDAAERITQLEKLLPFLRSVTISAFIDVGAFAVGGNGAGIRSDFLHQHYPGYRNTVAGQWVFMGDPFTTMINSLGDPAETADSREVENDVINSSGRPALIVNSIGLAIGKKVSENVGISALAQLLPRPGDDILEISYAQVIYRPTQKRDFKLEAGKIDSVLGVEYRHQDSHERLSVTPSLICRYTCGRPFGVSARYVGNRILGSAALTNGDNFEERFEPKAELRANKAPTAAAHFEYKLLDRNSGTPREQKLWLGASTAFGPQDRQPSLGIHQWHYGFDLNLINRRGLEVLAEFVQGRQQGSTSGDPAVDRMNGIARPACDLAPCLDYKGAYVLVSRQVGRLIPYTRFDWRAATHRSGADFVYEARSIRGTFGLQFKVNSHVKAKVEYNRNHELSVPDFPHDVITSSIVVTTGDD